MASAPVPFDITSDVLSRLPAKSLVRFRCVCKLWYSSQADPYFVHLHSTRSKRRLASSTSQLFVSCTSLLSTNQSFVLTDLRAADVSEQSMIFASEYSLFSQIINCLICVIGLRSVTVCNLSTREILRLPSSRMAFSSDDPKKSYYPCYLFGSDESGSVYKVLNICTVSLTDRNHRQRSRKACEIFKIGPNGNSWRRISGRPFRLFPSRSKPASGHYNHHVQSVCIKGIIYWIQHQTKYRRRMIGGFHVGDESFVDLIPFPGTIRFENPTIIEFNGRLALQHFSPFPLAETRMWVLEDDDSKTWRTTTIASRDIKTRAVDLGSFGDYRDMILGILFHRFMRKFVPSSQIRVSGNYSRNEKILLRHSSVDGREMENIRPLKRFC